MKTLKELNQSIKPNTIKEIIMEFHYNNIQDFIDNYTAF